MYISWFSQDFDLNFIICILAIIAGLFVITTKNAIISVFNLIVLYVLVAFYLIHIGIAYLGISYIVVYIGAIAILFLFVIMMIDIEVIEKKNNNYLLLLFFLLGGFIFTLKNILYNIGLLKIKNLLYKEGNNYLFDFDKDLIFNNIKQVQNNDIKLLINPIVNFDKNELTNNIIINVNGIIDNIKYNNELDINSVFHWLSILKDNNIDEKDFIYYDFDINLDGGQTNYLMIVPNWDAAISTVSQISAIGEVLYSTYNAYIYIVSVILLLAMLGAIILTSDHSQEIKFLTIVKNKRKASNLLFPIFIILSLFEKYNLYKFNINYINNLIYLIKTSFLKKWVLKVNLVYLKKNIYLNNLNNNSFSTYFFFCNPYSVINKFKNNIYSVSLFGITPFYDTASIDVIHSETIISTLPYYVISNLLIGLLLLGVNSYFSLSIKYLDKGGGFECGFTNFLQTRERYNIVFYRVALLFLVFDLEIILAFPFTAIYQKDESFGKNNILAFLFILVIGFIYELKEGALNIVKTAHPIEIKVIDQYI